MIKQCQFCKKQFKGRKESKFCSKKCTDDYRRGKPVVPRINKKCEWCGKDFMVKEYGKGSQIRFCSTSCSAKWRIATFGPTKQSEESKRKSGQRFKDLWKNEEYRQKQINRMKTNNPMYNPETLEKMKKSCLKHGYTNNFKYGNGKISKYEQIVYDRLLEYDFYYNYAIPTKLAKDTFLEDKFPNSYKPDFTNLKIKLCIEIDGHNHTYKSQKETDAKKEMCLNFLGFTIIRFTHEDIDDGKFDRWFTDFKEEYDGKTNK